MAPMGALGYGCSTAPRQAFLWVAWPCPPAAAGWVTSSSLEAHRAQPPAPSLVPLQDLHRLTASLATSGQELCQTQAEHVAAFTSSCLLLSTAPLAIASQERCISFISKVPEGAQEEGKTWCLPRKLFVPSSTRPGPSLRLSTILACRGCHGFSAPRPLPESIPGGEGGCPAPLGAFPPQAPNKSLGGNRCTGRAAAGGGAQPSPWDLPLLQLHLEALIALS